MNSMFNAISNVYNTNLSEAEIKNVYDSSIGEWKGKALNLINPFGHFAFKRADDFFNENIKGNAGFERSDEDVAAYEWAVKLVLWAGYSWIFAIEKYWDELIKADAGKRNKIVKQMIKQLKEYMSTKK